MLRDFTRNGPRCSAFLENGSPLFVGNKERAGRLYHKRPQRQRGFGKLFGILLCGFEDMLRDFTRNGPRGSAFWQNGFPSSVGLGKHAGRLYHKRPQQQRSFGKLFGILLHGFEDLLRNFTRNGPRGSAILENGPRSSGGSWGAREVTLSQKTPAAARFWKTVRHCFVWF